MKIAVTGATGFVGHHVVHQLAETPHEVLAIGRDEERLQALPARSMALDLHDPGGDLYRRLREPDLLIHLAWDGLPDYRGRIHIERNLWDSYRLVRDLVDGGLGRVACVGTCYEYGLQQGCLAEDLPPAPVTAYGVAKDSLRRFLESLARETPFQLSWLRLFFLHGEGQPQRALIPSLERAIAEGQEHFDMSGGEQQRDFMEVGDAARAIVGASLQTRIPGILNICTGSPMTVRNLVEQRIHELGSSIRPRLGVYPYPDHEPMEFWGDTRRLNRALAAYDEESRGDD